MILYVMTDDRNRIVSAANVGYHLGRDEIAAEFADELIDGNGHVDIYDDRIIPMYKLVDGVAVARTQEEMDADYIEPVVEPTTDEILNALLGVK